MTLSTLLISSSPEAEVAAQDDVEKELDQDAGITIPSPSATVQSALEGRPIVSVLPLIYRPPKLGPDAHTNAQATWLVPGSEVSEYLNLFYELVVVATLNTFSTSTEMNSPYSVGVFFTYFLIVWWLYVSQVAHDARYAAEDYYTRFFKLMQVILFAYIGAGARGWDIGLLQKPHTVFDAHALERVESSNAFDTISIAYAATRALLAVQYFVVAYVSRKTGRSRKPLLPPIMALVFSCGSATAAFVIPASSRAKVIAMVFLLYFGILVEMVTEGWTSFTGGIRAPHHAVSERFAALTLIIIGEGMIRTLQAFGQSITSFSNNGNTYVQVFLCVYNTFMLFLMCFARFDKHEYLGRRRLFLWIVLQFPLHFVILTALSAFNNEIIYVALDGGFQVINTLLDVSSQTFTNNSVVAVLESNPDILYKLRKLELVPPPLKQAALIDEIVANRTNPDPLYNTATVNLHTLRVRYVAQAMTLVSKLYGIESETAQELLYELVTCNVTIDNPLDYHHDHNYLEAVQLFENIANAFDSQANVLCFFLLPTAGAVLIMTALANMVRTPSWWLAPYRRWAVASQVAIGVGLCLLGLLNLGFKQGAYTLDYATYDVTDGTKYPALLTLMDSKWGLAVVTLSWTGVWVVHFIANRLLKRSLDRSVQNE